MLIIRYTKQARKGLSRIPPKAQRAIQSKIGLLAENPQRPELDIKKMQGEKGYFRLRVGTYRILYTEDGVILDIRDIGPRGSIYRN
ncbi:MAG: type II toxin-antitoxin system RelE/ParE family toxin [Thalassospira sp.]|uniref:type II toxin-antitoxin system RelE family toxin n=1 Tax=Thalassospira sp. TaxID=1912094 RepID=UPI0032EDD689